MIIKEVFSKFKDKLQFFLKFQEFSRTKVIFKDFSRSVRTLVSSVMRQRFILFQISPKDLDPSYGTDLDLCDCSESIL